MLIFLYKKIHCRITCNENNQGFCHNVLCAVNVELIFRFEYVSIFIFKDIFVYFYKRCVFTLKNKGASQIHGRTFLSKWFHKESLTYEEPLCFTKGSL